MNASGQDLIGTLAGSEIVHFNGILPAERHFAGGRSFAPPPSKSTPGGLILNALYPLTGQLDAALSRGDSEGALRLAYRALSEVVDALAALRGHRIQQAQARVHALLVELEPLPFEVLPDGTLEEQGTAVRVRYGTWAMAPAEVEGWARTLGERLQSLWPGAWVMLSPTRSGPAGR